MNLQIERSWNLSREYLEGIIPPEYMNQIKKECIQIKNAILYTVSEGEEAAAGYLLLLPCHYNRSKYEIVHMQVVLEKTENHVGARLLEAVVADLKKNNKKEFYLTFDREKDAEDSPEAFFLACGMEIERTFSTNSFAVQQLMNSRIHKKAKIIGAKRHVKDFEQLNRSERYVCIQEQNIFVNDNNKKNLHFVILNDKLVAMFGIYAMDARIELDDVIIFDRSARKEAMLNIFSYFTEYVCECSDKVEYQSVEYLMPDIKFDSALQELIGEPVAYRQRVKMIKKII